MVTPASSRRSLHPPSAAVPEKKKPNREILHPPRKRIDAARPLFPCSPRPPLRTTSRTTTIQVPNNVVDVVVTRRMIGGVLQKFIGTRMDPRPAEPATDGTISPHCGGCVVQVSHEESRHERHCYRHIRDSWRCCGFGGHCESVGYATSFVPIHYHYRAVLALVRRWLKKYGLVGLGDVHECRT